MTIDEKLKFQFKDLVFIPATAIATPVILKRFDTMDKYAIMPDLLYYIKNSKHVIPALANKEVMLALPYVLGKDERKKKDVVWLQQVKSPLNKYLDTYIFESNPINELMKQLSYNNVNSYFDAIFEINSKFISLIGKEQVLTPAYSRVFLRTRTYVTNPEAIELLDMAKEDIIKYLSRQDIKITETDAAILLKEIYNVAAKKTNVADCVQRSIEQEIKTVKYQECTLDLISKKYANDSESEAE